MSGSAGISSALAAALAGRYRLERELGAGGMATVYLAQDVRHHRRVAIKVLHPELSAVLGSERFLKEIELTANLQHPHMLPLFDSGEADGFLYYVMPYVEGETLRQRLEREQQLPVADAVRITLDVASALEYAHRHGIVHRDIKPENILLHDGRPIVADFGIALAVQQAGGSRMTQTGMSLGTPQYMSPEQAMGQRNVDHHADIYALGAVAYEMLAGEPPFTGPNSQAIVARVMTERPRPLSTLRDTVPAHVAAAVHTALQKLPADRFPSAAEFIRALESSNYLMPDSRPGAVARADAEPAHPSALGTRAAVVLGTLTLALAALAAWGWLRTPAAPAPRVSWRLPVALPDSGPLTSSFWLSDDGASFVYGSRQGATNHIRLWRAGAAASVRVEGTDSGFHPSISPNGRHIAFQLGGAVFLVVPTEGGRATRVADSVAILGQAAWLDEEHLVFANEMGLERVDIRGGAREPLTTLDSATGEGGHRFPSVLPGGAGVVFTIRQAGASDLASERIAVTRPDGGHTVLMPGLRAQYAHPGHLLVLRADGVLTAVPFDVPSRKVIGPARRVVAVPVWTSGLDRRFAVSRTGRLAFAFSSAPAPSELVRVTRDGSATPLDTAWAEPFTYVGVSPDGRRVAASFRSAANDPIQIRDLLTGGTVRIDLPGMQLRAPTFSQDGAMVFVAFTTSGMSLYRHRPGATPERVARVPDLPASPGFSPDGRTLYFSAFRGTRSDIFSLRLGERGALPEPLIATAAREANPAPSPDGRWLAYVSNETGRGELFVRAVDQTVAEQWQVSRSGADMSAVQPRWSRDGRELYYTVRDTLFAARVAPGETFAVTGHEALFPMTGYVGYDVLPGGGFVMISTRPVDPRDRQLVMLEDWKSAP